MLTQARLIGHHDPGAILDTDVTLKLRNEDQLRQFLVALYDPASPEYHQFLTPAQFTSRYGPTAADVSAVTAWLKHQGLTVTGVSENRLAIHLRAPSGAYEKAMGVRINDFRLNGRQVFGTTAAPRFPAALAGKLGTVLGLSNAARMRSARVTTGPIHIKGGGSYCPVVSHTPAQIATAYDWPSLYNTANGAGVTIAVAAAGSVGFDTSDSSDAKAFWRHFGLPTHEVDVVEAGASGTSGVSETTLDVEWAGAMAPGAAIRVYDGQPTVTGMYEVYNQIVSDDQAQVIATSVGMSEPDWLNNPNCKDTENCITAASEVMSAAAAEGITVVAAAGDSGGNNGPLYPSSDPNVVAAGGTTLTLNADDTIDNETAWNSKCGSDLIGATGGAPSQAFAKPGWQTGQDGVPAADGQRDTSDLALDADPLTGYYVYYNGSLTGGWGGTSFVAPELAGLFADFVSLSNGQRLGNANPAIYPDANSNHYASDFHDITQGNNRTYDAGTGWDFPTGWGSVVASRLLTHLAGGIALSAPKIDSLILVSCQSGEAEYNVILGAGSVGGPEQDELQVSVAGGPWATLIDGGNPFTLWYVLGGQSAEFRMRGYSGTFWTAWRYRNFHTAACSGGGGGLPKRSSQA